MTFILFFQEKNSVNKLFKVQTSLHTMLCKDLKIEHLITSEYFFYLW